MSKLKVMVKRYARSSRYYSIFVQKKFLFFRYWERVTSTYRLGTTVDRNQPILFVHFDVAVDMAKKFQDPETYAKFVLEQDMLYAKHILELDAEKPESNRVFVSDD